jgi:type II secretory pathway pseudopilin PulG
MIELIAMMAIMGLWIWSMLGVIWSGSDFAKDTEDTIKAINLAREGIEGVINLRNTNWLRFSSDKTNCWKVKDYTSSCIGSTAGTDDLLSGSYLLYTNNGAWYLSWITFIDHTTDWTSYRTTYRAWLDSEWFYTQTWAMIPSIFCTSAGQTDCLTPFNRQILINPIGTGTLEITSLVLWQWKRKREVTLTTTITNWKSKF